MDGIEATRQIRALEQEDKLKGHVPIIGISGTSRTEATQEMLDAGMVSGFTIIFKEPCLM